jgi:hypothetical protein
MMQKTVGGLVLVLAIALPCAAQAPCKRNLESGFSYCPPDGWTIKQSLDEKFKMFLGPSSMTLTPNINARDEDNAVPLADHVATSIKYILTNFQTAGVTAVKLLDQSEFVTTSGQRGIKVVFHVENTAKALIVRTFQYYFSGRESQKLVVTGSVLEIERNAFEPIFDRAMKTFQIDK